MASVDIETYGPGYEIVKERNPAHAVRGEVQHRVLRGRRAAVRRCAARRVLVRPFRRTRCRRCRIIAALLARTRVTVADDLTAKYPNAWPTRVNIDLADGNDVRGASDYPRGQSRESGDHAQLEDKFMALVAPRWGERAAKRAIAIVTDVESCGDMAEAFRDLFRSSS